MSDSDTTANPAEPTPHALAVELATRLAAAESPRRCLLLGIGSGRSVAPLLATGASVDAIEADEELARAAIARFGARGDVRVARSEYSGPYPFFGPYAAALSTNALLHGTPAAVGAALAATRDRLAAGAPFFLTLGSKRDPRFGAGRAAGPDTFVPEAGSERGVPHCYFDEAGVRALLAPLTLEGLEERRGSAGSWAHDADEAAAIVHWFVRARRP